MDRDDLRLCAILAIFAWFLVGLALTLQQRFNREIRAACLNDYKAFNPRMDRVCTVEVRGKRFPAKNLRIIG